MFYYYHINIKNKNKIGFKKNSNGKLEFYINIYPDKMVNKPILNNYHKINDYIGFVNEYYEYAEYYSVNEILLDKNFRDNFVDNEKLIYDKIINTINYYKPK